MLETGYGELAFAGAPLRVRAVEQRREDQAVAAALAFAEGCSSGIAQRHTAEI